MKIVSHAVRMIATTILAVVCIFYPFLPGEYDTAANAISTMVQLFGAAGVLLLPISILWLIYEVRKQVRKKRNLPNISRGYYFAVASLIVASILTLLLSLLILFGIGISFGVFAFALWLYAIFRLRPELKLLKTAESDAVNPAPIYLLVIPIVLLVSQLVFGARITEFSRNHAIANSNEFIGDIEAYHDEYGHYPVSLTAMWKDYYPDVVGIEKFHYSQFGESYNLFFEQPRFFFDNFGTREWVVYNPNDEHRMFSHTSWFLLLTPEELERSQGWYAVQNTAIPHWKYFWFD